MVYHIILSLLPMVVPQLEVPITNLLEFLPLLVLEGLISLLPISLILHLVLDLSYIKIYIYWPYNASSSS